MLIHLERILGFFYASRDFWRRKVFWTEDPFSFSYREVNVFSLMAISQIWVNSFSVNNVSHLNLLCHCCCRENSNWYLSKLIVRQLCENVFSKNPCFGDSVVTVSFSPHNREKIVSFVHWRNISIKQTDNKFAAQSTIHTFSQGLGAMELGSKWYVGIDMNRRYIVFSLSVYWIDRACITEPNGGKMW